MLIAHGLDAAIVDPCDPLTFASWRAALALVGRDQYCGAYLRAHRDKRFEKF